MIKTVLRHHYIPVLLKNIIIKIKSTLYFLSQLLHILFHVTELGCCGQRELVPNSF